MNRTISPSFTYEFSLWNQGLRYIAGADEVGRGCFAGPVVAAAVILSPTFSETKRVRDSKLLSAKVREELDLIIRKEAIGFAISEVSVTVINEIGIGKAAQLAFKRALKKLKPKPEFTLMDGFYLRGKRRAVQERIVHGDALCMSIAAASIVAKVYRDARMTKLHEWYKRYDFATNKGYGTKKHQLAIKKYGLSNMHRTSFNLAKFTH